MGEIFLKVVVGLLVIALVIIGVLVIFLAVTALWSSIQDCVYDEWGLKLPPMKDEWFCEWLHTGEVTKDVVPQNIMKCNYCDYKTTIMSRCCPTCGRYMKNWDPEWRFRKDGELNERKTDEEES